VSDVGEVSSRIWRRQRVGHWRTTHTPRRMSARF